MSRRGFTLMEMVLSLVLLGLVSALVVAVVMSAARPAARAMSELLRDRTVGTMTIFLSQELRDARSDDVVIAPGRVAMSRAIAEAGVCADSGNILLIADTSYVGTRAPEAGRDQLALLASGDSVWQRIPIRSVARARCPDIGVAATRLEIDGHAGSAIAIRVIEPVELSVYASGPDEWFGLTPADHSAPVQPFAGPLMPGLSRFDLLGGALDVTVAASGGPASMVSVPLGPLP